MDGPKFFTTSFAIPFEPVSGSTGGTMVTAIKSSDGFRAVSLTARGK